jgi:nucleoside-diphosphate-sugar epimerase
VNVEGTLNILLAARDENVRRVVFASSSSVYGANPVLPKREEHQPLPVSPYGVSKLAAEHYCRAFTTVYGLETVSLRLFNVFGPGQDPLSQYAAVVPRFITAISNGQQPTIYGDGSQTRDFTYIADVVEAFTAASVSEAAAGEVINIAAGSETSVSELVDLLRQLLASPVEARFEAARPGEVLRSSADNSKATRTLGWQPKWSLREALHECIDQQASLVGSTSSR